MYYGKLLRKGAERLILYFRAMRYLSFIPLLILFLFLPLLAVFFVMRENDVMVAAGYLIVYGQIVVPFFSVWWLIFGFHDYVEGDGAELLIMRRKSFLLPDAWILLFLYLVSTFIVYLAFSFFLPYMLLEFCRLAMISVLFFGLASFVLCLSRQLTATFMLVLLYTLFNTSMLQRDMSIVNLPYYYSFSLIAGLGDLGQYIPHLFLGIGLASIAPLLPQKRYT